VRRLGLVIALLGIAVAAPLAPIELRDLPGTGGQWQQGVAVIPAPAARVHQWLTDYGRWSSRFPDIEWAQLLGDDGHGRHIVRFRSRLAGRVFVIREAVQPELLVFDGWAQNVYVQGRIFVLDQGDRTSRVVMQSTAEVHGLIGLFATLGYRRKSAFAAISAHLEALYNLARATRE
jgi:hypothetical protein